MFKPSVVYYADSECLEYVNSDTFSIYLQVDDFLTLISDAEQNVIGFKLSGSLLENLKDAIINMEI